MKVVLFGSRGQVGDCILKHFSDAFEWICPERTSPGGDLLNPEAIGRYLCFLSPEAIVNAAAFTAVDNAREFYAEAKTINALAPREMARVASALGAYFIHLSTDYVFDGRGKEPWSEGNKVSPINAYGKTKALGEKLVLEQRATSVILRLSWLHAAYHKNFVTAICERLQKGADIRVVNDQWGSPTAALDVAEVIVKLLNRYKQGKSLNGIYHFANYGYCSRYDCALEIIHQLQFAEVPWSFNRNIHVAKTTDFGNTELRPLNCRLNTKKLYDELEITPHTWQDALGTTLIQYQKN